MTHLLRRWQFGAVSLLLVAASRAVTAQTRPDSSPPAEPRAIVGVVVDSANRPLDGADVWVENRRTRTRADGTFRLPELPPATYDLAVRKLGFRFQLRRIVVGAAGATVRVTLTPTPSLAPVVTVAARRGVSGTVSSNDSLPLANAEVAVVADRFRATTDSSGRFYLDLKPGRYVLRVARDGFRTQLVTVTLPRSEGRDVAVQLSYEPLGSSVRARIAAFDLRARLNRRSPVSSRLLTYDDLRPFGSEELNVPVARFVGGPPITRSDCFVYIDGGPDRMPLWALRSDDVELLEIYMRSARPTAAPSRRADVAVDAPGCGTVLLYAWMRQR